MTVRLLILGLLRNGPLHGYEIKRIIETEMGDWADVAAGSIYFALDKLAADTLIEEQEVSQEGGRPVRTIYRITGSGRAEFERLLREVWSKIERLSFPLDIGVAFMDCLLSGLERHQLETEKNPEVPEQARLIFSHHRHHYQAELTWIREVLRSL